MRGTVDEVLADSTSFHVHLTQIIAIGPGQPAQPIHRDQWAFDFFPFPNGFDVQCNTIWAMTDFTAENGATRLVPGSHRADDKLRYATSDSVPAEGRPRQNLSRYAVRAAGRGGRPPCAPLLADRPPTPARRWGRWRRPGCPRSGR